jgi:hypothetical protein
MSLHIACPFGLDESPQLLAVVLHRDSRMFLSAARSLARRSADLAFLGTCLLLFAAPFERLAPLVSLPAQNISTVEGAVLLAAGAWAVMSVATREWPTWRTPIAWPWAAWLGTAGVSAALAAAWRVNAVKVLGRLCLGWFLALLPINGVTDAARLTRVVWCATAGAVIVAIVAALEAAGVPAVMQWLEEFRHGVRVVGGQVRAGGTLQYPTIASMYLEIVFALALGAWLTAIDRHATAPAVALFASLAIIAEGIAVTLTRAGLITVGVSLLVVGWRRVALRGWDRGVWGLGALSAVVAVLVATATSVESLKLRLTTDGQKDWYRAAFLTPATLALQPDSTNLVEVTVINKGRVTWEHDAAPPFHVSYHWFDDTATRVVHYDGLRTKLTAPVSPGESARIPLQVRAPARPGQYTIGWDVVQEGRLWFSTESGARLALSKVTVGDDAPAASWPPIAGTRPVPEQVMRIGRPELWAAALRMSADHPLVGVGFDNFRLSYGPYAGVAEPDTRITSNNMYLEVLAGTGLVGLAAFGWLAWRLQDAMRAIARALPADAASIYSGVIAAVVAIAVHGLLDSFLTLTPTLVVISLTLGLAMAPARWAR